MCVRTGSAGRSFCLTSDISLASYTDWRSVLTSRGTL